MRQPAIVVIPKNSPGSMDALLPIIAEMRAGRPELPIYFWLLNERTRMIVGGDRLYSTAIPQMTGLVDLSLTSLPGPIRRVVKSAIIVALLLWYRIRRGAKPIVLAALTPGVGGDSVIARLVRPLSTLAYVPNGVCFKTELMQKKLSAPIIDFFVRHGQKNLTKSADAPRPVMKTSPDVRFEFWSADLEKRRREARRNEPDPKVLGFPFLYPAWQETLVSIADEVYRIVENDFDERHRGKPPITVILTNPVCPWFQYEGRYYEILEQTVARIAKHFPDHPIILKPKPSMLRLFSDFADKARAAGHPVYLVSCGLTVLAKKSVLALTINDSSGVFNFAINGVPVVEFAEYTDEWLGIYPDGSPWRYLPGLTTVGDIDEFDSFVEQAAAGRHSPASDSDLTAYFGTAAGAEPLLDYVLADRAVS